MNRLRPLILVALWPAGLAAAPPMTAHFTNGDVLGGTLAGVGGDTILWDADAFFDPIELAADQLTELRIPSRDFLETPPGDHVATVTLTNEDRVRGTLRSVTDEEIGLNTSFAGPLVFRRDMVAKLDIEDRPEILYAGPRALDEWTQSTPGAWTLDDGTLLCTEESSISREIGEHERIRVMFDVSWRERTQFRMLLHADGAADDGDHRQGLGNYYEFVCQSQYAYLRKRTEENNRRQSQTIGTTGAMRELDPNEKIRFEFLQDLTTGRVRLKLNGERVADWRDDNPDPEPLGSHLHFYGDQSSAVEISRIRVTSWDGVVEGDWQEDDMRMRLRGMQLGEPEETEEPEATEPGILLRNGDRIEGETLRVTDGTVTLKTRFKEFELPVSRLRTFALRSAEEAADPEILWKPIRRAGDIRAYFSDGGHITFEFLGLEDGEILGRSQTFGEARFDLSAFARIEFNLYRRKLPR